MKNAPAIKFIKAVPGPASGPQEKPEIIEAREGGANYNIALLEKSLDLKDETIKVLKDTIDIQARIINKK